MYTLGIPNRQYKRCTQVLGPENANPIEYDAVDQGDGFYLFSFPNVDEYEFKDIVMLLKNNGVSVIGADEQLSERKIMKLTDLLKENENPNRMESADDIIDALEKILETWETKEYESDEVRGKEYYFDIEELVEDYKENQSMDRPDTDIQTEQKLRNLIKKIIQE